LGTLGGVFGTLFCCLGLTQMGPCPFGQQPCATNDDCGTGLVCNTANGACVECLTDADCGTGSLCAQANGNVCVDCITDAHCDDHTVCTTDTCANAACVHTNVANGASCSADVDNSCDTDTCTAGACTHTPSAAAGTACGSNTDDTCTDPDTCDAAGACQAHNAANGTACDDGDACSGPDDVCTNGTCGGPDIADCCNADADCTAPETCDLSSHTCGTGPRVIIAGCPAAADQGDTVNLTSTTTGFTAGGTQVIAWTSTGATFVPADAANTAATLTASGEVTLTVTVTNTIPGGDNGTPLDPLDDPDDTVETDNDTCTIDAAFTAQLTVEAGGLNPDRATPSFYDSGTPGTGDNNALNGNANQQGVPPDAIATVWTATSQPALSGVVTFSNSAELTTAFRVGPPAKAGEYVFTLTATNENTSETKSDTVTLQLLAEPEVRVADGQAPMRFVMLRGTASEDVSLLYTSESAAFIEIFDGGGDDPDNLISALSVPTGADATATGKISATGNRETDNPDVYYLDGRITDIVDVGGLEDLENPNPTPDRDSLVHLVLLTTDSWVESDSTLTPKVIDLESEVGEVDGGGDVIHQGIGSDDAFLDVRDTDNGADRYKTGDINEDGFDDLIVLNGEEYYIDIFFGAPDIVTDHGFADDGEEGWPTYDYDLQIIGNCGFEDFCVGDVNGDGHLDIVTVSDCADNFVEVWLLDGADSVTRDDDADPTYTTVNSNNIDRGNFILCGDVGTGAGASGIDDIIAVSEAYDDCGGGNTNSDDGAVFVIYGRESLPASDDIEEDAVTGFTTKQNGERIFDSNSGSFPCNNDDNEFGDVVALGQWDSGGLDLVVGQGDHGNAEVRIYLGGGSRISRNPARVYPADGSEDLQDADAILADVTGDDKAELIVLSNYYDGQNTVYIVPNGLANTGLNDSQVFKYDLESFPLPYFDGGDDLGYLVGGDQVAAGDLDGDGVNELLIGNSDEYRVIAIKGPITSNIESPNDVFRVYEDNDGSDVGSAILFGDVTGDGLVDFMLGATNDEDLEIFQGFFTTAAP